MSKSGLHAFERLFGLLPDGVRLKDGTQVEARTLLNRSMELEDQNLSGPATHYAVKAAELARTNSRLQDAALHYLDTLENPGMGPNEAAYLNKRIRDVLVQREAPKVLAFTRAI